MRVKIVKEVCGAKQALGQVFPAIVIDEVAIVQFNGQPFAFFRGEFEVVK